MASLMPVFVFCPASRRPSSAPKNLACFAVVIGVCGLSLHPFPGIALPPLCVLPHLRPIESNLNELMGLDSDSTNGPHHPQAYRCPPDKSSVDPSTNILQKSQTRFGPPVHTYTRAQGIEDGTLVDVSTVAQEAGIRFSVALTRAAWERCVTVPEGVECQDEDGRLWDVLWLLRQAIRADIAESYRTGNRRIGNTIRFGVHVRNNNRSGFPPLAYLKSICGPGDNGEPVLTVMLPEED